MFYAPKGTMVLYQYQQATSLNLAKTFPAHNLSPLSLTCPLCPPSFFRVSFVLLLLGACSYRPSDIPRLADVSPSY